MESLTFETIRGMIYDRWPALRTDDKAWTPTIRKDFARALRALDVSAEQADAALGQLAMTCRSSRPYPREILQVLKTAEGPQGSSGGGEDPMTPAMFRWCEALDQPSGAGFYARAAELWISENAPNARHWNDISGALLRPNDAIFGRWSKRFLRWIVAQAEAKGWAIGADGTITRTRQAEAAA